MRNDHLAYAQATRVAGFGLLLQLAIGLTLLIFGIVEGDVVFGFASVYVLLGSLVWLSLLIIFHQHKLERLEVLEEDELAITRGDATSVFDREGEEIRVAARRLRLMHKWLMPIVSLLLVALLAGLGAGALLALPVEDIATTTRLGWTIAICLGLTVVSFIFSRFVAGMAKQHAWHNLRGGAAWMIGNALVLLAIAVGTGFRYFDNELIIRVVAHAIPIFMMVQAAEILLNFILNLYRPRIPGETPRPAFDSKLLSLLAAPDNLVRSINEAVNYQFGFDITSSWGYRLLMRSLAALVALGVAVLLLIDTMVVVEPHEQAIKLAGGRIVGDDGGRIHDSGMLWKLPWPLHGARVFDVTRVRELPLTAQAVYEAAPGFEQPLRLWSFELEGDIEFEPFLVESSPSLGPAVSARFSPVAGLLAEPIVGADEPAREAAAQVDGDAAQTGAPEAQSPEDIEAGRAAERLSRGWSLIDAEIVLMYRIKSRKAGAAEDGLIDYLTFASDFRTPRLPYSEREYALRGIALREVTLAFAEQSLESLLGEDRSAFSGILRERVQAAFDAAGTGIDVVAVNVPTLRPAGAAAQTWVELSISNQARLESVAAMQSRVATAQAALVGSASITDAVLAELDALQELQPDSEEAVALRLRIEETLISAGGEAARIIGAAERDRWVRVMDARGRALKLDSEQAAYRAAPNIYRERELMQMWARVLSPIDARIFVLGIDPARFATEVNYEEQSELFSLDAFEEYEANN